MADNHPDDASTQSPPSLRQQLKLMGETREDEIESENYRVKEDRKGIEGEVKEEDLAGEWDSLFDEGPSLIEKSDDEGETQDINEMVKEAQASSQGRHIEKGRRGDNVTVGKFQPLINRRCTTKYGKGKSPIQTIL